jgi:glycosyltransferase involved in cell wall biosynthesis
MNKKTQYSIVMPAYNTEKYIGEAITSVFKQTVSDWELIVIDDGSTDNTAEVVRQFSDLRIKIFSQNNSGISASRNKGSEVSGGEFIIFFDSDDRLYPDALERLGAAIRSNDKTIAVYGECMTINEAGKLIGTGKKPIFNVRPSGDILQHLLKKNFILPSATLIRKSVLQKTSGFLTNIEMAEDWEMFCRLAATGSFIYIDGNPVVEYRLRDDSIRMVESYESMNHKRMRCIDAVFTNPEITGHIDIQELKRSRCMIEAAAFSATACTALRARNWKTAASYLFKSLKRNPVPVRTREVILLCCALLRWLPHPVKRRLR